VVDPETLPAIGWVIGTVAVMVVVPAATAVALPRLPAELLMVATEENDELQVAEVVRSCVDWSENVPVAVNCWGAPKAMVEFAGLILSETRVADVPVRVVAPETAPDVAVIMVVPVATIVAIPPAEIVVTDVLDEFQATEDVRFCVELSEYIPVAVNCCVAPTAMLVLVGVTFM
jgi:hypothetical protein